jgi:hypothetical protein
MTMSSESSRFHLEKKMDVSSVMLSRFVGTKPMIDRSLVKGILCQWVPSFEQQGRQHPQGVQNLGVEAGRRAGGEKTRHDVRAAGYRTYVRALPYDTYYNPTSSVDTSVFGATKKGVPIDSFEVRPARLIRINQIRH